MIAGASIYSGKLWANPGPLVKHSWEPWPALSGMLAPQSDCLRVTAGHRPLTEGRGELDKAKGLFAVWYKVHGMV